MTKFKCMYCGKWHKDGSKTLKKHSHLYFKQGGTYDWSKWKTKK